MVISDETLNHFRKEAIIAESKITEKINKVLEDSETAGRRWFWELLQNAKDTVAFNYDLPEEQHRNVKNRTVDVILSYYSLNEELFLSFEHNGNPFSYSKDRYRFDDVTNLILPVSGKDTEFKTGKFGTGFLSTHVLSLKIDVEGVFLNASGQLNDFKFTIDRSKYLEDRHVFIESIVDTLKTSVTYTEHKNVIRSKFTYALSSNIKNNLSWVKNNVEQGLNDLKVLLPVVLCFNDQISSVLVNNEIAGVSDHYTIQNRPLLSDNGLASTHEVVIKKNDEEFNVLLTAEGEIQLAAFFIKHDGTGKKCLRPIGEMYKQFTQKTMPYLFSSFPLIGSEEFCFPMIINSRKFKPRETRDSISLKSKENGNQAVIEKAVALYGRVLEYIADEDWMEPYNILATNDELADDHKWISNDWYSRDVISPLRNSISKSKLIDVPTTKEQLITIRRAIYELEKPVLFPFGKNANGVWNFSIDLFPSQVPLLNELMQWNKILWDGKEIKKLNVEQLIIKVAEFKADIRALGQHISPHHENHFVVALNWLYDFVKFIAKDLNQINLLDYKASGVAYPILPNRYGQMKLLSEMNYDQGYWPDEQIEEDTLNLYLEFCGKKPGELSHKKFDDLKLLNENRQIKESDLTMSICDVVNRKIKDGNLAPHDKTSLGNLRNLLSDIKDEKLNSEDVSKIRRQEKYVRLYSQVDLDKVFLAVVEPDKIASVTSLLESDRNGIINIKQFQELAERPEMLVLLNELMQEMESSREEFMAKKEIGDVFEQLFRKSIEEYDFLSIKKVEGEEDFEVRNSKTGQTYYIEIKSATSKRNFVELSPDQGKAFSRKSNYILCIVPDSNLVSDETSFKGKAIFNREIGKQLKPRVEWIENFEKSDQGIEVTFENDLLKKHKKYRYKYKLTDVTWGTAKFIDFTRWILSNE